MIHTHFNMMVRLQRGKCWILFLFLAVITVAPTLRAANKPSAIQYNRDIRPILSENCFNCHGADSAARKASLRIDRPEDATAKLTNGVVPIVPGNAEKSEVIKRIFDEGDDIMPPVKTHKVLSARQKQLLKQWVLDGAHYQPHWAFIAPVKAPLPTVKNRRWVSNPIDAFVLSGLEKAGFKPAPEADRRTLARRVSYDLTGLQPDPRDVEAFVKDKSPNAYEKLVDKFLASPKFGEHRGRYWLDAARYGDTHGIHIDNYREIWAYRDWVINAFNQNMPFDEFTVEQLAGDLLPNPTLEQRIATGFNRCNITTSEGGAIDEEYLVLYARDRTDTTSQVFMGLTAGCAVCHDHKYDPLSQKEFYSMSAFFNNTTQAAMDGNIKDTPPTIVVPKAEDRKAWEELPGKKTKASEDVQAHKKAVKGDFVNWVAKPDFDVFGARSLGDGLVFQAPLDEGSAKSKVYVNNQERAFELGTNAAWQEGYTGAKALTLGKEAYPALSDVGDLSASNAFSCSVWLKFEGDRDGSVVSRMEDKDAKLRGWDLYVSKRKPELHLFGSSSNQVMEVSTVHGLPGGGKWNNVCITYNGCSKAAGVKIYVNGVKQELKVEKDTLTDSIHTEAPFRIGQRDGTARLSDVGTQDIRLYSRELSEPEAAKLAEIPRMQWLAKDPSTNARPAQNEELFTFWLNATDSAYKQLVKAREDLDTQEKDIKARGTIAHVMNEKPGMAEAYLLNRGEYDQRRDKVVAGTPAIFPPMPANAPRNRLGFAKWLVGDQHPLLARVTVNRFWQELFGTGIVRTAGDFGIAGEQPSNQELLDWMAVDFREHNWDIKRFYKLMLMTSSYRQSAKATPAKLEKDPLNRLISRGPRFRMDAEMIRDTALKAGGLLVDKIGGPSVHPYQPSGVWESVAMPESNTHDYHQDHGESLYRRSMYTIWKRAAPPASMDILNAPSRQTTCVRRERTDTPIQALVSLNDPQFVEASRALAELALKKGGSTDQQRVDFMAERLVSRPFNKKEHAIVNGVLQNLLEHYRKSPKDAELLIATGESKADASLDKPSLAAYTMVASEIMNLDENLNK